MTELKKTRVELENAKTKITGQENSASIPLPKSDSVAKLRSAQQKASELSARVKSLSSENELLKQNLDKMKTIVEDLQNKIRPIDGKAEGPVTDLIK